MPQKQLCKKKVKMVIADFPSVECSGNNNKPGEKEHQKVLHEHGILIVENAYSLWRVTKKNPIAFISPMAFPEINASPCRVLVYEEYK